MQSKNFYIQINPALQDFLYHRKFQRNFRLHTKKRHFSGIRPHQNDVLFRPDSDIWQSYDQSSCSWAGFFANLRGWLYNHSSSSEAVGSFVATVSSSEIPAFSFFPVLLQFWESDEEFPPQIKILWDDQTMRYLNFETTYYLQGDLLKRLQELL